MPETPETPKPAPAPKSALRLICETLVDALAIAVLALLALRNVGNPLLTQLGILLLAGVRVHDLLKSGGGPGAGSGPGAGGLAGLAVLLSTSLAGVASGAVRRAGEHAQ